MNMNKLVFLLSLALLLNATGVNCATNNAVDSHLSSKDLQRLQKVFADGIVSNDLQSIFYSSLNIEPTSDLERNKVCQRLFKLHTASKLKDYEKDFYLVGAARTLKCPEKLPEEILSNIYNIPMPISSTQEIFYRITAHKYLGVQIDEITLKKLVKNLEGVLMKEDSLTSLGYAFNVASELGSESEFVTERIEDAMVQADEVDGKMLQFEGGLSVTSLIITGAFKISSDFSKPPPVDAQQAYKFANYFLSRRSVQTPKGAHILIEALKSLTSITPQLTPVCIQLIGNGQLQADSPRLAVAIVDLLGKPLKDSPVNIFAKVLLRKEGTILAQKVQLVPKSSDKTTFVADLSSYNPTRGLYAAEIEVDSKYTQKLNFKVLGKVKVQQLELGIGESDASSSIKKQTIPYPKTFTEKLIADHTQRVLLKTLLVEEGTTDKPITVHQAFVRFYNKLEDLEVIYVAEQDSSKVYKFDMDVGARAGDFKYKSGLYEMFLIVGDASLSNSFEWHVANLDLEFPHNVKATIKKQPVRSVLSEISHQFRAPEKRPPRLVSDIFTGLCLTPLVILFIVWHKLGVNVSNFTIAPSTIGFHIGFGGILVLFTVFWLKLNMFQTLRLLLPIATFTFLCGNRLLRRLYAQRLAKTSNTGALATS
uniref:Dolichyl-diphosphooligosaccharide--protein glycosyltransferase subunit 2 n=1 Tax=Glossina brevipalpis TaxID=37001 RepID=A0A1A9WP29_9MUSC